MMCGAGKKVLARMMRMAFEVQSDVSWCRHDWWGGECRSSAGSSDISCISKFLIGWVWIKYFQNFTEKWRKTSKLYGNLAKTFKTLRKKGVFWEKLYGTPPKKGKTLRKTFRNSTAMEWKFCRRLYLRNFALPTSKGKGQASDRRPVSLPCCAEGPSCETEFIPGKNFGYDNEDNHYGLSFEVRCGARLSPEHRPVCRCEDALAEWPQNKNE